MSDFQGGKHLRPRSDPLKALTGSWTFVGLIISILMTLIFAVAGVELVNLGPAFHISALFFVVFLRKVVQILLAYRHNGVTMMDDRSPIISTLKERYIDELEHQYLSQMLNKHCTFDDFRYLLLKHYGFIQESDKKISQEGYLWWKQLIRDSSPQHRPDIQVSVPIHTLPIDQVQECIVSLANQSYLPSHVYLVINDDVNKAGELDQELKEQRDLYAQQISDFIQENELDREVMFHVILETPGKRGAMRRAFVEAIKRCAVYVLNIDGDTSIDMDSIYCTVTIFEADPSVASLTGDVRVTNPFVNVLTLVTAIRYFNAFNLERAAQSRYGEMNCLSGPFLAMRVAVLKEILDLWYEQEFLGKRCTFGDDRHLTTLILWLRFNVPHYKGIKSIYVLDCIAWTDVPVSFSVWVKQQLRWAKSGWRENFLLLVWGILSRLSTFVAADVIYLTVFPVFVLGNILAVLVIALGVASTAGIEAGLATLLPYAGSVIVVNFIFHSLYGLKLRKTLMFLAAPVYFLFWISALAWIKFYALIRLNHTGWGTKPSEEEGKPSS